MKERIPALTVTGQQRQTTDFGDDSIEGRSHSTGTSSSSLFRIVFFFFFCEKGREGNGKEMSTD